MCNLKDEMMLHRFTVPVYVCQDTKTKCIDIEKSVWTTYKERVSR